MKGFRGNRHRSPRMLLLVAFVGLLQGCGATPPSREPQPTAASTASAAPTFADKIVVGVHIGDDAIGTLGGFGASDMPLFPALANGHWWDHVVRRFVYSGVYRLDDAGVPVPDLAAAKCTPSEDLLTITCPLRDAKFHDGTPLTADDVAFTFELMASDECPQREPNADTHCVSNLASATARDPHTVAFELSEPDARFLTLALPDVLIESRARIEDSYDRFRNGSMDASPDEVAAEAERIGDELDVGERDCPTLLTQAETAVLALGVEPWSQAEFALGPGNALDPCDHAESLARMLTEAARSLIRERDGDRIGAIAAAYRILDYQDEIPIGSGPWKVADVDPGERMDLEAFEDYVRGRPETSTLEVRLIRTKAEAVNAVRDHAVDWLVQPFAGQTPYFLRDGLNGDEDGLILNVYEQSMFAMMYNVRKGSLFADRALREAVELCINKAETVAAASRGQWIALQSPVLSTSWAYEKNLRTPERDVERAMELIRDAGWRLDPDGYFVKDGSRLSAVVPVRGNRPERRAFLQLLADQVKDCGMEILPSEFDNAGAFLDWPEVVPETDRHWDAAFNGFIGTPPYDPGVDDEMFMSDQVTSDQNPAGSNSTGYENQEVDMQVFPDDF